MKTISVYENALPEFAAAAMKSLYRSIFSSPSFLHIYGPQHRNRFTYVAREHDEVRAVLLFEQHGSRVRVLNETLSLDAREIEAFAQWAFAQFAHVRTISFKAVHMTGGELQLPFLRSRFSEDIVVVLPQDVEAYTEGLGKSTRKNIKRYINKLAREAPGWEHAVRVGEDIREEDVQAIVRLNHLRMAAKGKRSDYDEQECARLTQLVRECGMVSVITFDGAVIAGEICSTVEDDYFCHVGAHDPRFDDCKLGLLSCYLAVCEAIRRRGREFHLLWGQYAYKYSLLGVQRDLEYLTLYRSRSDLYLNGGTILRHSLDARVRDLKTRVRDALGQQNAGTAAVKRARLMVGQWRGR